MNHNTENPVTFDQAKAELGCSDYYLTALKKQCGIKSRMFMLSTIRDFLKSNPGWRTTDVYPNTRKAGRDFYFKVTPDGKGYVVTMASRPDVCAEDKSLVKALQNAAEQWGKVNKQADR